MMGYYRETKGNQIIWCWILGIGGRGPSLGQKWLGPNGLHMHVTGKMEEEHRPRQRGRIYAITAPINHPWAISVFTDLLYHFIHLESITAKWLLLPPPAQPKSVQSASVCSFFISLSLTGAGSWKFEIRIGRSEFPVFYDNLKGKSHKNLRVHTLSEPSLNQK